MTIRAMAKTCLAIFGGFNIVFLLTSPLNRWIENLTPFMTSSSGSIDNNTVAGLFSYLQERNQENNSQYWDHTETEAFSNNNISIIVELSGELGNHLNHIAHGRILQIMLLRDYNIVTHLVLRRNSNDEKYRRTQRQLTKCFTKLRQLEFHQPQSSALTSQKTLDRIQATLLGKDLADALHLYGGTSINMTQQSIQVLASQVKKQHMFAMRNETMAAKGVSFPFLRTNAMINRDMMDKFYDELREFFDFDEEACCAMEDLPDPNVTVFHFRNFLGELKQKGKSTGLEELSAHKVATEVFARSSSTERKSIAIATRFPGRKASEEYVDALSQQGFEVQWLTTKNASSNSFPAAMLDFCAMRRTTELVGMVRSTFLVWAALLGNPNGIARLYSVDSTWTRKKFAKHGKPIFRTYNWTNPELQRRIHFELYKAEDLMVVSSQ